MATDCGRLGWIDTARGVSMLAIYLIHTEFYYTGGIIIDYAFYAHNALSCFFFISGYLFPIGEGKFDFKRKIKSVAVHIILPYFIFTALIAFPKAFVHGNSMNPVEITLGILKGQASWFVTALAVAEIIFSCILALPKKHSRIMLPAVCAAAYTIPFYFDYSFMDIWNMKSAMTSLIFMYSGFVFHTVERRMAGRQKWLLLPLLVAIKYYEHKEGFSMVFNNPSEITSPILFLADNLLSCLFITTAAKYADMSRFVRFIGKNSLIWYFLAGGVPLLTGMALTRLGLPYSGHYIQVLAALAVECCITSAATIAIMKYAPFMLGKSATRHGRKA